MAHGGVHLFWGRRVVARQNAELQNIWTQNIRICNRLLLMEELNTWTRDEGGRRVNWQGGIPSEKGGR